MAVVLDGVPSTPVAARITRTTWITSVKDACVSRRGAPTSETGPPTLLVGTVVTLISRIRQARHRSRHA